MAVALLIIAIARLPRFIERGASVIGHSLLHADDRPRDRLTLDHPRVAGGLSAERLRAGEYDTGQRNQAY